MSLNPKLSIECSKTEQNIELGSQDTMVIDIEEETKNNTFKAFYLTVLSSFFTSLAKLAVKIISISSEKLPTFQIIFLRYFMLYLFCITAQSYKWIFKKSKAHFFGHPSTRYLLTISGLFGFMEIAFGIWALQHMNIGEFNAIKFIAPVFIGILSFIILKEYLSVIDIFGSLLSIIGVFFIAQPPGIFPGSSSKILPLHTYGVLSALLSSFSGACEKITMRKLGMRVSPLQATAYGSLISVILSLIFFPLTNSIESWKLPRQASTYGWIIIIGITGFIGHMLISKALQIETAIKVVTYSFVQVLISFLLEGLVFGSIPSNWSLIGSAIIGLSIIGTAVVKYREEKRKKLGENVKELDIQKTGEITTPTKL